MHRVFKYRLGSIPFFSVDTYQRMGLILGVMPDGFSMDAAPAEITARESTSTKVGLRDIEHLGVFEHIW